MEKCIRVKSLIESAFCLMFQTLKILRWQSINSKKQELDFSKAGDSISEIFRKKEKTGVSRGQVLGLFFGNRIPFSLCRNNVICVYDVDILK